MAKKVLSGVGVREVQFFTLAAATGLPNVVTNSGTLQTGRFSNAVTEVTFSVPDRQRFSHYGRDRVYAQDDLPPSEGSTMTISGSQRDFDLDAYVEGNKVRQIDNNQFRAGNTDKRGSEPQMFINYYRQALDTDEDSPTFGKLRQWEATLVPSVRLSVTKDNFSQGTTTKTYNGTPTPVRETPWGEAYNDTDWGNCEGDYIDGSHDYVPVYAFALGDGTLTTFTIPSDYPPVSADYLTVWVDGTKTTPQSTSLAGAPYQFTLSSAPADGTLVGALSLTNAAGC